MSFLSHYLFLWVFWEGVRGRSSLVGGSWQEKHFDDVVVLVLGIGASRGFPHGVGVEGSALCNIQYAIQSMIMKGYTICSKEKRKPETESSFSHIN